MNEDGKDKNGAIPPENILPSLNLYERCTTCHEKIIAGRKFCVKCGTRGHGRVLSEDKKYSHPDLHSSPDAQRPPPHPPPTNPPATPQHRLGRDPPPTHICRNCGHPIEEEKKREKKLVLKKRNALKQIIMKEGFLHKRGSLFPSWKRRYFVLAGETLTYYEGDKEDLILDRLGVLYVPGATMVVFSSNVYEDERSQRIGGEYLFGINPARTGSPNCAKGRMLVLGASSHERRYEWLKALKRQGAVYRGEEDVTHRHPKSIKEGYIWKMGRSLLQKWNKRYCVLLPNEIRYYRNIDDNREAGIITLYPESEITIDNGVPGRYQFSIISEEEGECSFRANDDQHRQSWMLEIKMVIGALQYEDSTDDDEDPDEDSKKDISPPLGPLSVALGESDVGKKEKNKVTDVELDALQVGDHLEEPVSVTVGMSPSVTRKRGTTAEKRSSTSKKRKSKKIVSTLDESAKNVVKPMFDYDDFQGLQGDMEEFLGSNQICQFSGCPMPVFNFSGFPYCADHYEEMIDQQADREKSSDLPEDKKDRSEEKAEREREAREKLAKQAEEREAKEAQEKEKLLKAQLEIAKELQEKEKEKEQEAQHCRCCRAHFSEDRAYRICSKCEKKVCISCSNNIATFTMQFEVPTKKKGKKGPKDGAGKSKESPPFRSKLPWNRSKQDLKNLAPLSPRLKEAPTSPKNRPGTARTLPSEPSSPKSGWVATLRLDNKWELNTSPSGTQPTTPRVPTEPSTPISANVVEKRSKKYICDLCFEELELHSPTGRGTGGGQGVAKSSSSSTSSVPPSPLPLAHKLPPSWVEDYRRVRTLPLETPKVLPPSKCPVCSFDYKKYEDRPRAKSAEPPVEIGHMSPPRIFPDEIPAGARMTRRRSSAFGRIENPSQKPSPTTAESSLSLSPRSQKQGGHLTPRSPRSQLQQPQILITQGPTAQQPTAAQAVIATVSASSITHPPSYSDTKYSHPSVTITESATTTTTLTTAPSSVSKSNLPQGFPISKPAGSLQTSPSASPRPGVMFFPNSYSLPPSISYAPKTGATTTTGTPSQYTKISPLLSSSVRPPTDVPALTITTLSSSSPPLSSTSSTAFPPPLPSQSQSPQNKNNNNTNIGDWSSDRLRGPYAPLSQTPDHSPPSTSPAGSHPIGGFSAGFKIPQSSSAATSTSSVSSTPTNPLLPFLHTSSFSSTPLAAYHNPSVAEGDTPTPSSSGHSHHTSGGGSPSRTPIASPSDVKNNNNGGTAKGSPSLAPRGGVFFAEGLAPLPEIPRTKVPAGKRPRTTREGSLNLLQ